MSETVEITHVRYVDPGPSGPGFRRALADWWGDRPLTQLALFLATAAVFWLLGTNMADNMHRLGLTPGFAFLGHAANFEIGESVISYSAGDSYLRAFVAGLLNTVRVAVAGCALATVLGIVLGIARLSTNPLLSRAVQVYVELVRNTPLLLQLFFWNTTIHALPGPRQALSPLPGVLLSNRGLFLPAFADGEATAAILGATFIGLALVYAGLALHRRRVGPVSRAVAFALPAVALTLPAAVGWAAGVPLTVEVPALAGFNIRGGVSLTPEYVALLIGLVVNASAGIAETVRGGILSVPTGQWEAARALGLPPTRVMRLVVLPQALRVIVPVLTSSWLSLTKNSSLAVAIGFPDLVSVLNTSANVTGQALEAILIMMSVYLLLSLTVSVAMNAWNRHWALRDRSSA